jgi:hypothetical protein
MKKKQEQSKEYTIAMTILLALSWGVLGMLIGMYFL